MIMIRDFFETVSFAALEVAAVPFPEVTVHPDCCPLPASVIGTEIVAVLSPVIMQKSHDIRHCRE